MPVNLIILKTKVEYSDLYDFPHEYMIKNMDYNVLYFKYDHIILDSKLENYDLSIYVSSYHSANFEKMNEQLRIVYSSKCPHGNYGVIKFNNKSEFAKWKLSN